ncbi:MAG: tRNA threonylcarbamoyladenosine dehydratase [Tissierellia bacterium]|nr:tRNA threonylcarbamoyladenosine dehydratase [Tissierellia bacterium]
MDNKFIRSQLLLGEEGIYKLKNSTVAVFGIGGVGSFASEALVRSGLGKIILIDYDIIDISNLNRQIHATTKTIGLPKVDVMKERLLEINPEIEVVAFKEKYNSETRYKLISTEYDYVVDAIDMITSKIDLIVTCKTMGIPIISSMGAGNKLDPTAFSVGDIYSTHTCPLAKVIRQELRKRNIESLKVVWSKEKPMKANLEREGRRKAIPGSVSFVPSVAGLIIASEVIKDLIWG